MIQAIAQETTVSPNKYFTNSWKVKGLPTGFFSGIDTIDISLGKDGRWHAVLEDESGVVQSAFFGDDEPQEGKSGIDGVEQWSLTISDLLFTVDVDKLDRVLEAKGKAVESPNGAEEPAVAGTWGSEDAPPKSFWKKELRALHVARAS